MESVRLHARALAAETCAPHLLDALYTMLPQVATARPDLTPSVDDEKGATLGTPRQYGITLVDSSRKRELFP